MKVKLLKHEIMTMNTILNGRTFINYRGPKFCYALDKCRQKIESEVTAISKALKVDEKLLEPFEVKKNGKVKADKNAPVQKGIDDMSFNELKEHVKTTKADEKIKTKLLKKIDENIEFLNDETEIEIYGVKLDVMPDDIKENDYRLIRSLVHEGDAG